MTDYTLDTGTDGTMMIRDENGNLDLWIKAAVDTVVPEMPWAFTLNGVTEGWRSFDFQAGGLYQLVTTLWVGYTQTVIFHLGDTGTADLGGPTDLSVDILRGSSAGVANVKSGAVHKTALVYVRDGGVWKSAETWVRVASVWRRTG